MDLRQLIRTGIAASAVGHLSILAVIMIFAEVHPFGAVTVEPITVDIVSPEQAPPVPKKEEPLPDPKTEPSDVFNLPAKSVPAAAPAPAPAPEVKQQAAIKQQATAKQPAEAKQQAAAKPEATGPQQQPPPQQQAALSTPSPDAAQPPASPLSPPPSAPTAGYAAPEPDVSVKYHVMLGLPPPMHADAPKDKSSEDFDSAASKTADVASSIVTEFRRHVRTCSKLPASVAPSDRISVKLRVLMAPDGRLLADPILIEGTASAKGVALMQSAVSALQACQPYAMLPADRYNEWKVLDLSFAPPDFDGAS